MRKKNSIPENGHSLRGRAEEIIAKTPDAIRKIVPENLQSLIEELHIHQIELELQNEELRRAQLELEAARDEFSDLYDFAPVGYFTVDAKGLMQKANLTGAGMLGWERGKLIGKPFSRFICKDDQDIYYLHHRQLVESRSKKTSELRLVRKDGSLFDAHLESIVILNEQSGDRDLRIAVTDITETNLVATRLKEYEKIVESMNDAVMIVDIDHNCRLANKAFLRIHHTTIEQVTDRKVAEIWGEEFYEQKIKTQLERALAGETVECEMSHLCPKTGERQLTACYFPIYKTEEGKTTKIASIMKDITGRKQIEEHIRQVKKMETIGQLAGGIAHDFNNQLQVIMGYADLLCHSLKDEKDRQYAEMIVQASQRSANLTGQLLAFARKGKNICAPVDVHKVIFEVVSMLTQTIDKIIVVKQTLHAHPSVVMGDPTQLQNALLNLGVNARDAMPQGGQIYFTTNTITLDDDHCRKPAFIELSPEQHIQICVTDNGVGIDEKTRARIFEPFFTTKDLGKGTGMGLAAVYGIVKNHFGSIEVESEEGQGATFKIYLPLIEIHEDNDEAELPSTIIKGTARILVVDDEELVRNTAIDMLHSLGYKVVFCKNGLEAVDYYKNHWREIDLVILDMIMPKMGGRRAFMVMKEINPGIKALFSSGYSLEEETQAIIDEGVQGFIQKPFNLRELSKIVAHSWA